MIEVRLNQLVVIKDNDSQVLRLEEATPLEGKPRRLMTLVIGPTEAAEISRCIQKIEAPRPLTHQLALAIATQLGGTLQRTVIHDLRGGTFYAEMTLDGPAGAVKVDCRPSDAIALSLRAGSPVYVTEQVMAEAGAERA
ncbi:MAG: bifunctional nuclease family protein [Planctomycetes bacterium]|nr:bifunctional nuclease family protein [Planctomycetota bacterium]MBL7009538.1 bifunctional nuclease family protein [Planctomycetota bacterium]